MRQPGLDPRTPQFRRKELANMLAQKAGRRIQSKERLKSAFRGGGYGFRPGRGGGQKNQFVNRQGFPFGPDIGEAEYMEQTPWAYSSPFEQLAFDVTQPNAPTNIFSNSQLNAPNAPLYDQGLDGLAQMPRPSLSTDPEQFGSELDGGPFNVGTEYQGTSAMGGGAFLPWFLNGLGGLINQPIINTRYGGGGGGGPMRTM